MTMISTTEKNNTKMIIFIFLLIFSTTKLFSQEKPNSQPNNGNAYPEWTINDYDDFVKNKYERCVNMNDILISNKKQNLKIDIYILENKKSSKSIDENEYNLAVNSLEKELNNYIQQLKNECIKNILDEIEEKKRRIEYENSEIERKKNDSIAEIERQKKQKNDAILEIAKRKEVLNSFEYKNWKTKYLTIFKSADANILIINNLEKKYSFRNNYGNKVWDPNSLSKQDKLNYNKNYEAIGKKLDDIRELQKIERNQYFENLYLDSVISLKTNEGMKLYYLSEYYNNHEKLY